MTSTPTSIDQYHARYGLPKPMTPGSKANVFGDGKKKHLDPLVTRRPKTTLPGLESFNPNSLEFLRAFSNKINEEVPVDLSEDLFTISGNYSSADTLRTVAGYMMNPMSYVPKNNAEYREQLGLKPKYDPRERQIALNVWRILFSCYKPTSIKVPKKSNSGPPRDTYDAAWKKSYAEWIFEPANMEGMLTATAKGDFLTLRNKYEHIYLMSLQKRDQVDTPGKVREVYDRQYAITNGREGGLHPADKHVVLYGQPYDDFSATRARVINAGPWPINVVMSMVSSGTMKGMFERFPTLFHTNTPEDIKAALDGNYIYCGDVKEYDRSMSQDAIDVPHEAMAEFWDERLALMSRCLYHSAYYSRPLELDGTKGVFVGNYEKFLLPQVLCGNRSGHNLTSLIAKGNKVVDTLLVLDKLGLPVLDNELTYLESKGAINMLNNGDDEVVYTPDKALIDAFEVKRADPKAGHYIVTPEEGQVFSGYINRVEKYGALEYFPSARPLTAFQKIYIPERPIGGNFRPFWAAGIMERVSNRSSTRASDKMWEIHDQLFHDILSPHIGSFYSIISDAVAQSGLSFEGYTAIDKEVLDDPDKLYHKFDPDEVTPSVLNMIVSNIEYETFEPLIDKYYRGHVL